jgi:hypothetical protein
MGRAEKTLLLALMLSAAGVGWMVWDSRGSAVGNSASVSVRDVANGNPGPVTGVRPAAPTAASHLSATVVTSSRAAPQRNTAELSRKLASGSRQTYLDHMLLRSDSTLARWSERYAQPIKVWIQPSSSLPDWSSDLPSLMQNAFNTWHSIFVPVRFETVGDSSAAEITVTWRAAFDGSLVGATRRFRDQHGWLGRAEIQLALRTSAGALMDRRQLSAVMIHEVGHALGIDHSPDPEDIMAERTGAVFHPSARDIATLALIYDLPPGSIKQ